MGWILDNFDWSAPLAALGGGAVKPTSSAASSVPAYSASNPPSAEAIYNPAAYGTKPVLPPTTTDTTTQTTGWTPNLYNYDQLSKQASDLASQLMGGSVSQGTLNLLNRQAAERGVGFGSDAPITNAQFLAATGQMSENLALQGGQLYNQLLQSSPRTTTTTGSTTHDLSAWQAILNAAPDPYAKAMAEWAAQNLGLGLASHTTSFAPKGGGSIAPGFVPPNMGASSGGYSTGGLGSGTNTQWKGASPFQSGDYGWMDPLYSEGLTDTAFGDLGDYGWTDPGYSEGITDTAFGEMGGEPGSGVLLPWNLQDWSVGGESQWFDPWSY